MWNIVHVLVHSHKQNLHGLQNNDTDKRSLSTINQQKSGIPALCGWSQTSEASLPQFLHSLRIQEKLVQEDSAELPTKVQTVRWVAWFECIQPTKCQIFKSNNIWINSNTVCLFWSLRLTWEFFPHMKTSPLLVKGCKFWPMLHTYGHWTVRVL